MKVESQGAAAAQCIDKLLVVQSLDTRLRDLERELHDIPLRRQEEQARLADHTKALEAARDKVKQSQSAIKQLDVETGGRRDKIARLRQQQLELKTNKEFQVMEHEIGTLQEDIAGIEDQELVRMEDLEAARAEMVAREKALAEEEAAVARDVAVWNERMRALDTEIAGLRAAREEAAQGIEPAFLRKYETIFERKMPALAAIEDGVCGGCHMRLPPYVLHDARRGDGVAACDFCGRLLHWPA